MAELKLAEVSRSYGPVTAVDNLSLHVPDGALACLLGPSGCGKTTTLRLVAGLELPDRGSIRLGERNITGLEPRHRAIGMMFQGYALYPHLSVRDNIAYPLRVRGVARTEREARVREIAEMLAIEHLLGRSVRQVSGGQAQRVALARAIIQRPSLFLLDEPISALDAAVRAQMRSEIKRLQRLVGTTMVVVTHDQLDALGMADLLVVMRDGAVEQVGAPAEVHDRPANAWVASFIGEPRMNLFAGRIEERDGRLGVRVHDQWIELGAAQARAVTDVGANEVLLGVRPADVELGEGGIAARVSAALPQGTRSLYELDANGLALRAETAASTRLDIDQVAHLVLPPEAIHVFAVAGERIA